MTLEAVRQELAAAITAARSRSLGLTAEAAGLTKQTLVRIEKGEPTLTVARARAIAGAEDRPASDFFRKALERPVVVRASGNLNACGKDALADLAEVPLDHVVVVMRALRVTGIADSDAMDNGAAMLVDG